MADLSTIAGPRLSGPKRTIVRRPGRQFVRAALALILALPAAAARAQQPFITDDTDVTARGRFHFEFSNEFDTLQRAA